MKIGIISDTHGLLREKVKENLNDCNIILHAGDIGKIEIIDKLEGIGHTFCVKGNCDKNIDFKDTKESVVIDIKGIKFYLIHDIKTIKEDLVDLDIDIVIFGHSHKKDSFKKDNMWYINPGSVGPKRFNLPITMAKLEICDLGKEKSKLEFIEID
ncbi:metallophosphoesterase family protein [Paraclostridium bifermentans]|uniref:metallophosphoesterase family protein n=1 Tax=Paraclostridium bifermentans TaxID=1490 RepID=UPI00359C6AE4